METNKSYPKISEEKLETLLRLTAKSMEGTEMFAIPGDQKSKKFACKECSKIGRLFKCSRCKDVYYCSKECQKKDWKLHKIICE